MIEFVLLFTLGFLAAALVALIAAPVIQRRIVKLTEQRMRASVPLSTAEIRAEKDMARASFAAENARLSIDLKHSREQLTESTARGVRLSNELVAIRAEKDEAEKTIEARDDTIRDLQSELTDREAKITTLTGNFSDATRLAEARKQEMAKRDDQINRLGAEIEELRIDLVTLDTEAESFKSQIRELRDERNALREKLKDAENANADIEQRLKTDAQRLAQTEEKLARTISTLTDRENALERRIAEVERFRRKNRELADETRAAKKALKDAVNGARGNGAAKPQIPQHLMEFEEDPVEELYDDPPAIAEQPAPQPEPPAPQPEPIAAAPVAAAKVSQETSPPPVKKAAAATPKPEKKPEPVARPPVRDEISEDEKIDRIRARQAALIERLLKADKSGNDAALRREIASVAAMMVELTATRDGPASPIFRILKGNDEYGHADGAEPSLAARARDLIANS